MSTSVALLAGGFFAAALGFSIFATRFSPSERARRKVARGFARAHAVKAADATVDGYVSIEGKVLGGKGRSFKAPLSGRHCVWARATARERRDSLLTGDSWSVLVAAEVVHTPFVLKDGSAEVCVDPEGADVVLEDDEFEETGTIDASTPAEAAFLERRGVGTKSWASDKRFRIQEQAICTKRTIRVAGTVRRVTASPETHGCELALSADDGDELYISNMSDAALTKPTTLYLVGTWLLAGGLLSIFVGGVMAYFESR